MNKLLSTYGCTKFPFSKEIAPAEMFRTEILRNARELLIATLEGRSCAVVTAESGCGKTCLWRAVENDLPQGRYRIHYLHNSTVNRRDFYRQISMAMGLEPRSSYSALFASVSQHIGELASQHKLRVVLALDEAHLLPIQVLEQIHLILNYERDSKPWLSIVLIGLPPLRETLKRNVMASLMARFPCRIDLAPLDPEQVKDYLRHRMTTAGCKREIFADDAMLLIAKATSGIMRRIDVLAEQCLLVALPSRSQLVDASVVHKAIQLCGDALL